jgi:hypothetical protein
MENKTTSELLEILFKKGTGAGDKYDQETQDAAFAELSKRSPFWEIFNEDWEESLPAAHAAIRELREEIKLLKRHKHDPKSGDVMVRI